MKRISSSQSNDSDTMDETACMVCGRIDGYESFLLCDGDGCLNGSHFQCLELPCIPSGSWFCRSCATAPSTKRIKSTVKRAPLTMKATQPAHMKAINCSQYTGDTFDASNVDEQTISSNNIPVMFADLSQQAPHQPGIFEEDGQVDDLVGSLSPSAGIHDRAPDQPRPRLSASSLVISRVFCETDPEGIIELFADTAVGKWSLHDLIIHQHFDECYRAMGDINIPRAFPNSLACCIKHFESGSHFRSFVSGYDAKDCNKAYQLEFEDSRDSYWSPCADFEIRRTPDSFSDPHADMRLHERRAESRPLRALEVCCGGKSFSRQLIRMFPNAEVITLDISSNYDPDITADICEWDYLSAGFEPSFFDIMWLSPPCTEYSRAKTSCLRDIDLADAVAQAAKRLLKVARPLTWIMENPHTMLYKRAFMQDFEQYRDRCTYCRYGYDYKKDTDIWSNIKLGRLHHCDDDPCPAKAKRGRHVCTAQQGNNSYGIPGIRTERANSVPRELLHRIITKAVKHLKGLRGDRVAWKI